MLGPSASSKIYLCMGYTDMRKGLYSLTLLVSSLLCNQSVKEIVVVFRGKNADKIKLLWWDGQGFCLFYKCFETGRFMWPKSQESGAIGITRAQLSMLLEGIDWRMPKWAAAPKFIA